MKSALKVIGIGLLALAAIPVVLYLALVLSNLRDDDLDPGAAKLLARVPDQIPIAENGYFAWVGVGGPATVPPEAWGKRWVEESLAADKKAAGFGTSTPLAIESERRKCELDAKLLPCNKPETCFAEVAAKPEFARATLAKGAVTLARCDVAIGRPAYQEPWRPDFSVGSYFPVSPVFWRQLSATRFALAVTEKRHDEALNQLGKEMAFHTRQMRGAVSLVEKLLATAYLRNDYLLLNQYLLLYPEAAKQRAEEISRMLAPLPPEAVDLSAAMETEWLQVARLFPAVQSDITAAMWGSSTEERQGSTLGDRIWNAIASPLFLPTATTNELHRLRRPLFVVDSQSGSAYRQALADVKQQQRSLSEHYGFSLRNPIGHVLVLVGASDMTGYFARRDDLLAVHEVVALQLHLLRQGVSETNAVGRAIAAAGLVHPFTGAAPAWDAASRTLIYPTLPERKNEPLAISL